MSNRTVNILVPVIAVLLGLLAGGIIMLVTGYDPFLGYSALLDGVIGNSYNIGETIRQAAPLILAGLAVAFAFKTGLFNIGVEGQVLVGWLAAVWVGTAAELPKIIHLPLALIAAVAAGALWAFIPGILKAKFRVHEVIVSIMLNYTALYLTNYVIYNILTNNADTTEKIAESASLRSEFLSGMTDYSRLHWGIVIAMLGSVFMWYMLDKTKRGFELRAVGLNEHASQYAGMNVSTNIVLSMVISGALAGLAGAMEGLGTYEYTSVKGGFSGIGFDGIAVALLGGSAALGVVLAGFLFAGLKMGALNMPFVASVPSELVDVVIALIIFFVASSYVIRLMLERKKRKGAK